MNIFGNKINNFKLFETFCNVHVFLVSLGIATIISLLGRCKANDEQLAYIETRVECLHELRNQIVTKDDVKLKDVMRVFHGDSPATQLEAGQQKGGHYFCAACGIHASRCAEVAHSYYLNNITLKEK